MIYNPIINQEVEEKKKLSNTKTIDKLNTEKVKQQLQVKYNSNQLSKKLKVMSLNDNYEIKQKKSSKKPKESNKIQDKKLGIDLKFENSEETDIKKVDEEKKYNEKSFQQISSKIYPENTMSNNYSESNQINSNQICQKNDKDLIPYHISKDYINLNNIDDNNEDAIWYSQFYNNNNLELSNNNNTNINFNSYETPKHEEKKVKKKLVNNIEVSIYENTLFKINNIYNYRVVIMST